MFPAPVRYAADTVSDDRAPDPPRGDAAPAVDPARLDALAGQLVWRIGRASDDAPLTVRVGLASSAAAFAELPRLHNASEAELREALDAGEVRVEWVGARGR